MKNIYLVKKDPNCKKEDIKWRTLDAAEFIAFTRSEEGRGRHFIRLPDETGESGVVFIETDEAEYREWKREYDRHTYLRRAAEKCPSPLSLDAPLPVSADFLDGLVTEETKPVEEWCIRAELRIRLHDGLVQLPEADAQLIRFLYFDGQKHTEAQLASILGISQQAVHRRKIAVLKKLRAHIGC